jgi:hypothetical protein
MTFWVAGTVAATSLIGTVSASKAAGAQARAAGEATQAQRDIANEQTALQREQYLKQLELNEPFRQAGLTGQNMLLAQLQGGPYASAKFGGVEGYDPASVMRNFGAGDFQADPGYAFRLSEGLKGMNATAAARGGLLSGNALRAGQEYGQQLGSQEYQNAFNRYQANRALQAQEYGNAFNRFQTERTNTLAPLQSLAGVGQSASQQAQQASQNYATGASGALGNYGNAAASNIIGAGNARASGYIGGANALSSGVGQGINFYQNRNLANQLQYNNLEGQYGSNNVYGGGGYNPGYTPPTAAQYAMINEP